MSTRRRWLALGTVGVIAGGLGALTAWRRYAPGSPDVEATELLFALNLPDAQGAPIGVGQWRGQPMVVNFWATWCAPCVEEMPELSELQSAYGPRGLQIIGLGIDSPDNIRKFSVERPVVYPLLVAGAGGSELTRRFGNQAGGLPYTVVVDRNGRITRRIIGRFRYADLRDAIEAVVG
ncbi:MAG: TlpA disulfide reductase family protein [Burkholderiaceae bacterium]